jgi:hypothetical protein
MLLLQACRAGYRRSPCRLMDLRFSGGRVDELSGRAIQQPT